jgi:hypothetical protein
VREILIKYIYISHCHLNTGGVLVIESSDGKWPTLLTESDAAVVSFQMEKSDFVCMKVEVIVV